MQTYVILLKGINVGGKNILPMKGLTALLEKNGCENVKTYIQSGNVVLKSKQNVMASLAKLISREFGFEPELMILKKDEFLASIKHNPYQKSDGKTVHFYFCNTKLKVDHDKLDKYRDATEEYQIYNKVFLLHAPKGIGRSRLVANIESCLGVPATGRNLNTIKKIAEMLNSVE